MSLNGKRENFNREDFYSLEKLSPLFSKRKINTIIDETVENASSWPVLAKDVGVPRGLIDEINNNLRVDL
jgi:serine/threonine-protein kinase HipA